MLYYKACSVRFCKWEQTLLCKEDGLLVSYREMNLLLAGAPRSLEWKEELTTGFTTEEVESVEKQEKIWQIREAWHHWLYS